ncbi:putative proteasome-type protease [Erwinia toletana]|uniref:Proteasome-type protease n=1 Tax=Winslowiella toletana TaxID=92490 RepID=A0ABS4P6J5_9GAMM|nr:proteasome-type protease [Winslowiella toletana]MBP2168249.1 putative proteasome-type protease [Winslowiella toletana]
MTYCVAMRLSSGMIFVSDTRTNAGVDHISSFRKLHVFQQDDERTLVLQSAGNLATTQSVLSLLRRDCGSAEKANLMSCSNMYDVALLVGDMLRDVLKRDGEEFSGTLLLGGQIKGEEPRLFQIYPQGNFIEASVDTPYFQIGESKYGKPIIDRVLRYDTPLDQAMQCALISMDSTLASNISVGLPLDVMFYHSDTFSDGEQYHITEQHPYYSQIRQLWSKGLLSVFSQLPPLQL